MQYQFAGADPQGRLIYEPVNASPMVHNQQFIQQPVQQLPSGPCSCGACHVSAAPKKDYKSFFSSWFVVQDGVISLSLRTMTIFFSVLITLTLIAILIASCNDGTGKYQCTLAEWPMISDVIC
jgi:hypothetical protein